MYDVRLNVHAYEISYALPDSEQPTSDDAASAVILSAFAEFGLRRVVGHHSAFLDASSGILAGNVPLPIPAQRVTLQVRDYDYPITSLARSLSQRKDEGFSIALDDFTYSDDVIALLHVADYVKVDVRRVGVSGLREHQRLLQEFPVKLVATGLTNSTQVRVAEGMDYRFFQGDFLFKPQVLERRELPSSFSVVTQLLAKLRDPNVEFVEIDRLVRRDAGLSVAVLRFLNSSAYGFRQEVTSVQQAVSLLGLREFTKWTVLVVLAERCDRPPELVTTALVRARMCELLAKRYQADAAQSFMVGLLSVLDALLGAPMAELLAELPLAEEVRGAILDFTGPCGELLESVMRREHEAHELPERERTALTEAWLDAVQWADEAIRELRPQSPA